MKNLLPDAHTHSLDERKISLLNYDWWKEKSYPNNHFFVGFHPWYLDQLPPQSWQWLKETLSHPLCIGIGEIGLDRRCKTPWKEQISYLEKQIQWAEEWKISRFSFHVVKSFSDIKPYLKYLPFETKLLWHDFNGHKDDIEFLNRYNSYYSCGKRLLDPHSRLQKAFPHIPKHRLLLESDEEDFEVLEKLYAWVKDQEIPSEVITENFNHFLE